MTDIKTILIGVTIMFKISSKSYVQDKDTREESERSSYGGNLFQHQIDSISLSNAKKKILKNPDLTQLDNEWKKDEYLLLEQSAELSAQLQKKIEPELSLPFKLKGKMGIFLGAGVLASVTAGALSYRHYFANKSETIVGLPEVPEKQNFSIEDLPGIQEVVSDSGYIRVSRHANYFNSAQINYDDQWTSDIIDLLQQEDIIKNDVSVRDIKKEILLPAVAKYLYDNNIDHEVIREKKIAMTILAGNSLYGGRKQEVITEKFSKAVISNWLFNAVLSTSPGEYMASKINNDSYPNYFTISSLRHIFSLNSIFIDGLLRYSDIPVDQWGQFNSMWYRYLENELPLLKYLPQETDNILLNSQEFADLYTGSAFLDNEGQLNKYTLKEAQQVGEFLWQIAMNEGININTIGFYMFPSLVISASKNVNNIHSTGKDLNVPINILENYLQYRNMVMEIQQDIIKKNNKYKSALKNWTCKGDLADEIISYCPESELPLINSYHALSPLEYKRKEAKQLYLMGMKKPCSSAPENLDNEYVNLTRAVADSFFEIDKILIWLAISNIDENEFIFIFSPSAKIRKIHFSMHTNRPVGTVHGVGVDNDFSVYLQAADLFSVSLNNQERIYALKKTTDDDFYKLIRVDRNIRNYIDNGILSYTQFSKNYRVEGNKIIDRYPFVFRITALKPPVINSSDNNQKLIDFLAKEHSDNLYNYLYQKGDKQSDIQKVWEGAKHFIPFYDCVSGIIDNDPVQAVPACFMDVITLIPISGQAVSIGSKFTMSFFKGINKAGGMLTHGMIKNAGKRLLHEIKLPKVSELVSLNKNALRAIDPGFELVTRGGKLLGRKLDSFLRQKKNGYILADKILSTHSFNQASSISNSYATARLPDLEIDVPVKKIATDRNNDIYTLVDPETGELFGKYYNIINNQQLKPISEGFYKQQVRQPIYNMDQYYDDGRDIQNGEQFIDISHIPAQTRFLSPSLYIPLEMHLTGFPYLRPGVYRHLADDPNPMAIAIKDFVTMNYGQNDVFYCKFDQSVESIPEDFAQLRNHLPQYKSSVLAAKRYVDALYHEFSRTTMRNIHGELCFPPRGNRIGTYLSKVLQLNQIADANIASIIKKEAMERLLFHTERVYHYLQNEINNIYFVSSDTAAHPYTHRGSCPMGFMNVQDEFRRVIIMVDAAHVAPVLSTQMHLTVLHEVSHYSGTLDFQMAPSTSLVGDASEFMETFNDGIFGVNNEYIEIKPGFVEAYRHEHPGIEVNENHIRELLKRDLILRANAFMENADFMARMISDLGSRQPYDRDVHGRKRRSAKIENNKIIFSIYKLLIDNPRNSTLNTTR